LIIRDKRLRDPLHNGLLQGVKHHDVHTALGQYELH
jgi:hypothetical protein